MEDRPRLLYPPAAMKNLKKLLEPVAGGARTPRRLVTVTLPQTVLDEHGALASRLVIAWAMNLLLLDDVLRRVPEGALYVDARLRQGERVVFDHGAIRTVDVEGCGALPRGQAAFRRLLEPLGYRVADVYPLPRLKMTGRALCHVDLPAEVPQFFLSELHVDRFDDDFAAAVGRVVGSSVDPLDDRALASLDRLSAEVALPIDEAGRLLPDLVACFDRQHGTPSWSDYQTLLERSAEMAWIATEGNAFNHATDRVDDVVAVAAEVAGWGVPIKDAVEVSTSQRVLQTATRATRVLRPFVDRERPILREVPGSFFEFITRREEAPGVLDLKFDAGNATAIFKMTDGGSST